MSEETNIPEPISATTSPAVEAPTIEQPTGADPEPKGIVAEAIAEATKEYNAKQSVEALPLEKPVKAKKITAPKDATPDNSAPVQDPRIGREPVDTRVSEPDSDLPPIAPPQFWEGKDKEAFKALPYDAQRTIVKYETQARTWASQIAQQAAEARKIQKEHERVIEPHRDLLKSYNTDPIVAFENALTNASLMERDPIMMISRYMRQYGLTPEHFLNGYQSQPPQGNGGYQTDYYQPDYQEYTDPRQDEALREINEIKATLKQQADAVEAQRQYALKSEIDSFRSETDETGNPLHPHFEDFRAQIAEEVQRLEHEGVYSHPRDLMKAAYRNIVGQFEEKFIKPRLTNGQYATKSQLEALKSKKAEAAAGSLSGSSLGASPQHKKYAGNNMVADAIADARREVLGA